MRGRDDSFLDSEECVLQPSRPFAIRGRAATSACHGSHVTSVDRRALDVSDPSCLLAGCVD